MHSKPRSLECSQNARGGGHEKAKKEITRSSNETDRRESNNASETKTSQEAINRQSMKYAPPDDDDDRNIHFVENGFIIALVISAIICLLFYIVLKK